MRHALTLSAWVVCLVAVMAIGSVMMIQSIRPAPALEVAVEAAANSSEAGGDVLQR